MNKQPKKQKRKEEKKKNSERKSLCTEDVFVCRENGKIPSEREEEEEKKGKKYEKICLFFSSPQ